MSRFVLFFLLALSLNVFAADSFEFVLKEVGSPDEVHMYTPCSFGGASFECHVDFGMKQTELNALSFYKNKKALRATESKDAFGKVSRCFEYIARKLKVGSVAEKDFLIKRCQGKRLHQAVIGIDFFKGKTFEINYDKEQIAILTEPIVEGEELYLLADGYIGLSMKVADKVFKAVLDTGVGKTVIDKNLVDAHKDQFGLIEQSEVSTPTGAKFTIGLYRAKKLRIGQKDYQNLTVQAMPFEALKQRFGDDVMALVGNNILTQDNWAMDLVNRRYRISPRAAKIP